MKNETVYVRVMVEMYMKGLDSHELAEKIGISYHAMRRLLRGESRQWLEDALRIRKALACDLPVEVLFERRNAA